MTLSDLEQRSKTFGDTKHRAVSLRQLSFLLYYFVKHFFATVACQNYWRYM